MRTRCGLRAAALVAASLFLPAVSPGAAPASRPNVLIVMTDDQGLGDFSGEGNPVLKTPALDRLREQAVRFSDFHSAPMCTPTRGQLMTGTDAVRNGATSVTGGRSFIRPGIPTMPEILAAAGYRTGIFGKWHLGDNYPHRPMDRGFQEAVYHLGWGFTSAPEFANTLVDGRYFHNGTEERFSGHCTDLWFDQAMAWMRERKARNEPFFCYLPTNAPHGPHIDLDEYIAPYQGLGPAAFFGMIAHVDRAMDRLDRFLAETGLRDDTILIFMTDNGGTAGVNVFNAGLRGRKTEYYEGGHRVPCWVRWPAGRLGAPRGVDVPAQMQDILPTVLELCGIARPSDARFDGSSLAPLLRGTLDGFPERALVVQYSRATLEKWQCAVIWNQWRLVHGTELYDVRADRAQKKDLASARPDIVSRLRRHYERWWEGMGGKQDEFVTTSIGSPTQPLTKLTSSDWQDVYADNAGHVRTAAGGARGGHWNLLAERAGDYEIVLRRWPREVDLALEASMGLDGKALPVATAVVSISGKETVATATPGSKAVAVRVRLPAGPLRLQAWFRDTAGKDLCGAYYADIAYIPSTAGERSGASGGRGTSRRDRETGR